jgi:hypothetical protein
MNRRDLAVESSWTIYDLYSSYFLKQAFNMRWIVSSAYGVLI